MTPGHVAVTGNGNRVTATAEGAAVCFEVHSPRGMGGARVELAAKEWPVEIALRLHLAGLELLRFSFERRAVTVSVASHGDHAVLEYLAAEGRPGETPIEPGSAYWMAVLRTPRPDVASSRGEAPLAARFDVAAPRALHSSGPCPFSFEWLDFYR
jgi:hypothetical protein